MSDIRKLRTIGRATEAMAEFWDTVTPENASKKAEYLITRLTYADPMVQQGAIEAIGAMFNDFDLVDIRYVDIQAVMSGETPPSWRQEAEPKTCNDEMDEFLAIRFVLERKVSDSVTKMRLVDQIFKAIWDTDRPVIMGNLINLLEMILDRLDFDEQSASLVEEVGIEISKHIDPLFKHDLLEALCKARETPFDDDYEMLED